MDVHHLWPLEWAHIGGGRRNPNDLDNLVAVSKPIHYQINTAWRLFKNSNSNPTTRDIQNQMKEVMKEFGEYFVYPK